MIGSFSGTGERAMRAFKARVRLVMFLFALGGVVVALRAWQLQVVRHERFSGLARRQGERVLKVQGRRGSILDRHGELLAFSLKTESVYAHPSLVKNDEPLLPELASVIKQPLPLLRERLQSSAPFVWLMRQLSPTMAAEVRQLSVEGVGFVPEYKRVYPARELASTMLGFAGVDSQGLAGLEYAYNSHLRGEEHFRVLKLDALGRQRSDENSTFPQAGGNLRLSLDSAIQFVTERALAQAVVESQAQLGIAVVLHSPTGAIMALAQYPQFNPNAYQTYSSQRFTNHAITSGYEPGSIMKTFTVAAAMEEQQLNPREEIFCEQGSWQHHDSVIHDSRPHEYLSPRQVIQFSSNICAAKIGLRISPAIFHSYMKRLGFGSNLGIFTDRNGKRLASEATGRLPNHQQWTAVDHAALSFGHGLLVSPLQLAAAINIFANDGVYIQPYIIEDLLNPKGKPLNLSRPQNVRQVFSPATTSQVRSWMEAVTEPNGTGNRAAIPYIRVAGKTGTTEIYDIQAQGYSKTLHLASFAGFLPANQPQLTIVVIIEQPLKGRYGGTVAAPVFQRIAIESLPILGVSPPSVRQ